MIPTEFSQVIKDELVDMFCGKLLGEGIARRVFEFAIDSSKVVKIEDSQQSFQNVLEWETWKLAKQTIYKDCFAPCHYISASGGILIQERTIPIRAGVDKLPDRLPGFFTDTKIENFGWLNGKLVAHDYGLTLVIDRGLLNGAKTRKVNWWSEDDSGLSVIPSGVVTL